MARGTAHSSEVKSAVMAALLAGQSIDAVATEYKLPLGTVKGWSVRARPMVDQEEVGDLILDNLVALLTATRGIVERVSQDANWIGRQEASSLAVFVGVLYDKAIRIAEALPEPPQCEAADPA